MERLVDLALLFFTFSFLGWCMEVALKYRQYHRFINRGFLTGPWLPIYGTGVTLITVAVGLLPSEQASYGAIFLVSFVLCGAVEYGVSWFLEKYCHARWWDYSQKPMNLNGRVWIGNLMLFGLAGVIIGGFLDPLIFALFDRASLRVRAYIAGFLTAVMVADLIMTLFILKLVKTGVESSQADNTEQINREVRLLLSDRSVFHKRFAEAYPEVVYRTDRIAARMEAIKAETERLRREAELRREAMNQRLEQSRDAMNQRLEQGRDAMNQRLEQGREQLAATLETSASIRGTIIRQQDELIDLLYDEAAATDRMRALKDDIDKNMERLEKRRVR